jgi:hypothetical protein
MHDLRRMYSEIGKKHSGVFIAYYGSIARKEKLETNLNYYFLWINIVTKQHANVFSGSPKKL